MEYGINLIKKELDKLDVALSKLAKSDSAIQYAPHIEDEFYNVIDRLNELKSIFNFDKIQGFDYFD